MDDFEKEKLRKMVADHYFIKPLFFVKPFMRIFGHPTTKQEFIKSMKENKDGNNRNN